MHSEKTFCKIGASRNFFLFKMGAYRKNFSSKWVYSQKTFAAKLMHQDKLVLQNGCIKSLSFTPFRKRIILLVKVTLHAIKLGFSFDVIQSV